MSKQPTSRVKRILIMGAAGRDFHNFNICFRDNSLYEVVGFTASQIPNIDGRVYPPELAGALYPRGVPIYAEKDLNMLIHKHHVDKVAFSYSDISHEEVMHRASVVTACGADFLLIGTGRTMLPARQPVIAICAVRTGCVNPTAETDAYVPGYRRSPNVPLPVPPPVSGPARIRPRGR